MYTQEETCFACQTPRGGTVCCNGNYTDIEEGYKNWKCGNETKAGITPVALAGRSEDGMCKEMGMLFKGERNWSGRKSIFPELK